MNEERFLKVIAEALEVDVDAINLQIEHGSIEEWDSLGQLSILSALSHETGGLSDDIDGIATLSDLSSFFKAVTNLK